MARIKHQLKTHLLEAADKQHKRSLAAATRHSVKPGSKLVRSSKPQRNSRNSPDARHHANSKTQPKLVLAARRSGCMSSRLAAAARNTSEMNSKHLRNELETRRMYSKLDRSWLQAGSKLRETRHFSKLNRNYFELNSKLVASARSWIEAGLKLAQNFAKRNVLLETVSKLPRTQELAHRHSTIQTESGTAATH